MNNTIFYFALVREHIDVEKFCKNGGEELQRSKNEGDEGCPKLIWMIVYILHNDHTFPYLRK